MINNIINFLALNISGKHSPVKRKKTVEVAFTEKTS